MPPKAKKGKKKADEVLEPEHDPSWERAVESGVWERAVTALPDANTWPTWGALRERVLTACREVTVTSSPTVRDAFVSELVKLSPAALKTLNLHGSTNLRKAVLSPMCSCPSLETLDLGGCPNLGYVLVQSASLRSVNLASCGALTKVIIQAPRMEHLTLTACPNLDSLLIWSDELVSLDLTAANCLTSLELHCPNLSPETRERLPAVPKAPVAARPVHPPIAAMLRENCREAALAVAELREREWRGVRGASSIAPAYRPLC